MDCTITTARTSMNNLLQLQSIKTQTMPISQLLVAGQRSVLLRNELRMYSKVETCLVHLNNTGSIVNFHISKIQNICDR